MRCPIAKRESPGEQLDSEIRVSGVCLDLLRGIGGLYVAHNFEPRMGDFDRVTQKGSEKVRKF